MFIKCGLHQDSGAAAYAQLPRCPVAAAVVSEGITATESWNHPLAPERLSAAERLVVPSERAQLDPPEIKKEKKKICGFSVRICSSARRRALIGHGRLPLGTSRISVWRHHCSPTITFTSISETCRQISWQNFANAGFVGAALRYI